MKRAVERFLVYPLSNLVATGQVGLGDLVYVDLQPGSNKLFFSKRPGGALVNEASEAESAPDSSVTKSDGIALPLPQTKVARRGQGRGERTES